MQRYNLIAPLVLVLVAIWGSTATQPALAAGPYQVIDLGVDGNAYDINNANQVVGAVLVGGNNHARLWQIEPDNSVTPYDLQADINMVPTLTGLTRYYPRAINDAGWVAGWAEDHTAPDRAKTRRAFFGSPGAGGAYDIVDLQAAFPSEDFRLAYDINNAGTLVGALDQNHPIHSSWPQAIALDTDTMTLTVLDMDTHPHTTAHAISETEHIVGYCEHNPVYEGASWADRTAPLVELYPTPVDPPNTTLSAWAWGVNDNGQVVGFSRGLSISNADTAATFWDTTTGGAPVNLDPADLFERSRATDINNDGQAVGWGDLFAWDAPEHDFRAFIWEEGTGIVDLNTLINPSENWLLTSAASINEAGWIAGVGLLGDEPHALVLIPEPSTATLLACLLVLAGLACRWRR